jgi:hypothetical protein
VVGGVETESQNGGTSGMAGTNYVNYYQGGTNGFQVSDPLGQKYFNELTEYVAVNAHVAQGHTGSASAGFDTKTAQPFTFTNPNGTAITSTSLDGAISVAVTKTKTDGIADASASMLAQSGADNKTVGTDARLHAEEYLSGVGSAVAQVSNATAKANAQFGPGAEAGNYSASTVAGDIKLTASNTDDNSLAHDGGVDSGLANIESASYESNNTGGSMSIGRGITDETLILHANRGASFSGRSYADGYLIGNETTESQWVNISMGRHSTSIVDLESTSQIDGSVVAFNIRDIADVNATLRVSAITRANGSDYAHVDWNDIATAVRDSPYDGTAKVEANGYVPVATWISSATTTNATRQQLALVKGMQGSAWDGAPAMNPGFGVGAWILNSYNPAQRAQMEATQTADTARKSLTTSTFVMSLKGMSAITGTQKDAVGAFGAVANQFIQAKNLTVSTGIESGKILRPLDTNAINWIVGDDLNLHPGYGKESPINMLFTSGTSGIQRFANLTYNQGS